MSFVKARSLCGRLLGQSYKRAMWMLPSKKQVMSVCPIYSLGEASKGAGIPLISGNMLISGNCGMEYLLCLVRLNFTGFIA